jgi:Fic family protein
MPESPPNWAKLFETAVQKDKISLLLHGLKGPSVHGKYLHWDKLVYYPPENGFTHNDWWLALKLSRISLYKPVPLKDKNNEPFVFAFADPIPEYLHFIDQGAGGFIEASDKIAKGTRDRYYINSLIEEAITSSQLEGATTTRVVAKEMIRTNRAPRDKSEKMIQNNFLTMKRINDLKDEPLTKNCIFEMHKLMTFQTLEDTSAAGRFRKMDEPVIVADPSNSICYTPPPADSLEERLEAMCAFANGETPDYFIHPVLRSIILHFWLAFDHPFVDGNGRTARALFYWSMLRSKYWLFEFLSISNVILKAPSKYYRAFLYTETDDNDLTYFILYHLGVIKRSVEALHSYIARKAQQIQDRLVDLKGLRSLNHRQRALIDHALRHPQQIYTVESHRNSHNVTHETARLDLRNLYEMGLLEGGKVGKTWHYTPRSDLEAQLRSMS